MARHPLDELPPGDAYNVLTMSHPDRIAEIRRLLARDGLAEPQRHALETWLLVFGATTGRDEA